MSNEEQRWTTPESSGVNTNQRLIHSETTPAPLPNQDSDRANQDSDRANQDSDRASQDSNRAEQHLAAAAEAFLASHDTVSADDFMIAAGRALYRRVLELTGENRRLAARVLRIRRTTLQARLTKLGIGPRYSTKPGNEGVREETPSIDEGDVEPGD